MDYNCKAHLIKIHQKSYMTIELLQKYFKIFRVNMLFLRKIGKPLVIYCLNNISFVDSIQY